jgi:2,4-dienoyl-CoA reductase-like NADH-dependent reductase (Old Yellow Enzyme family)
MTPDLSPLFTPFTCKSLHLRNRIVMSPMTREFAQDGVLVNEVDGYYARRATGGAGLIVTEGTAVDHPVSHATGKIPYFYGDGPLARWRSVVQAVHAEGGAIVPQLWHAGPGRRRSHTHNPDRASASPSGLPEEALMIPPRPDSGRPRRPPATMTAADIEAVIEAFVAGAVAAKNVGCDGVAIHGAHGYLLDQFFWARSNLREDEWGGSLENRIRFGVETVRRTRAAVGEDFAIPFRFSQWKNIDYAARLAETPDELERILVPLAEAGVDIFDVSARRFWLPAFDGDALTPGRMDQEANRQGQHGGRVDRAGRPVRARRQCTNERRVDRESCRAGRDAGTRRVRPRRCRPCHARQPCLGQPCRDRSLRRSRSLQPRVDRPCSGAGRHLTFSRHRRETWTCHRR